MKLSLNGLDLIKSAEGYHTALPDGSCAAYLCPAGVATCGWGATEGVKIGDVWTRAQAEARLMTELAKHEAAVQRLVTVDLTQGQYDGLVSFSYNVGYGKDGLGGSTLLKKLNAGDAAGACGEFGKWNKATVNGVRKELRGLTIRRAKEAALFAERETAPAMAQKIDVPKEPMSGKAGTVAGAVGASSGIAAGGLTLPLPPVPKGALDQLTAWQAAGKTATEFGVFLVGNPGKVGVILVLMAAVLFLPKLFKGATS